MQLMVKTEGVFLGVSKTDYVSTRTGQPGTFFNIAVKQGGEVGQIPCEKALYEKYMSGELKDFMQAGFDGVFNDRYNRLQITAVHPVK